MKKIFEHLIPALVVIGVFTFILGSSFGLNKNYSSPLYYYGTISTIIYVLYNANIAAKHVPVVIRTDSGSLSTGVDLGISFKLTDQQEKEDWEVSQNRCFSIYLILLDIHIFF